MTWVIVYDSNTGSDFASSHGPVSAGSTLVNGWTDTTGNIWTTASGNLLGLPTASGNPPYQGLSYFLLRPSAEDHTDSRIVVDVPAGLPSADLIWACVRNNRLTSGSLNEYAAFIDGTGDFQLWDIVNGLGTPRSTTTFSYNSGHTYELDMNVIGTSLTAVLTDTTASTVIATLTYTDSAVAGPGSYALCLQGSGSAFNVATRVRTYQNVVSSFSLSPSSGNVSNSYSVTATGTGTSWTSGTTFSGSGVTGCTVTTNSVNAGAQTASLTITTGSSAGTLTIADSTDALTSPFTIANIVPVTDTGFYFSPQTWVLNGSTSATANSAGAYFWFNFTGTSAVLNFNTTTLSTGNLYLKWSIDGGPFTVTNITGTSSLTIGTGLANAAHSIIVYYDARDNTIDAWTTPQNGLIITGMTISTAGTTSAYTPRPYKALFFGDSRVEGYNTLPGATPNQDVTLTTAFLIGEALNCEIGMRAFSGMDYVVQGGQVNVPPLFTPGNNTNSSWNKFWAGTSMLTGSVYTQQPDYIFVLELGGNGRSNSEATEQASVNGFMTAVRAAAPSAKIYIGNGSYDGYNTVAVNAAFNAYQTATPDPNMFILQYNLSAYEIAGINFSNGSTPTNYCPADGIHPDALMQAIIAARLLPGVNPIGTAYAF